MSLYSLASRISSAEFSVDELSNKADSNNAVLTGTATINGPAFLNGPVALGSSITCIDQRCGRITDKHIYKRRCRSKDI